MTSFAPEELARYVASDLDRTEPDVREIALDRLGSLSGDHVGLISGRLADPDPEVRGTAAVNLGRVRRASAWPHLLRASSAESSDDVRRHIVAALAPYHDSAILARLLELLARRDGDYQVRMEVAVQLWKYSPELVEPVLVELVRNDGHDTVRIHAAESLEMLDELGPGDPARRELWLHVAEDGGSGAATVAERALRREVTEPAADILAVVARRLHHPEAEGRSFALHRLSMLAPASAVMLAQPLVGDEHPEVRAASYECLGAIRDTAAIPLLLTALRTEQTTRGKVSALIGLEHYHAPEIGVALLEQLEMDTCTGDPLSILGRQLWKYPSGRSVELLRRILASQVKLPHRSSVESSLAFLERFLSNLGSEA